MNKYSPEKQNLYESVINYLIAIYRYKIGSNNLFLERVV